MVTLSIRPGSPYLSAWAVVVTVQLTFPGDFQGLSDIPLEPGLVEEVLVRRNTA